MGGRSRLAPDATETSALDSGPGGRRLATACCLVTIVVVLVALAFSLRGSDKSPPRDLAVAVSSTEPDPASISDPGLLPQVEPVPPPTTSTTMVTLTVPAVARPTTTTVLPAPTTSAPCRNSRDPACGPFRWDPPPADNHPLSVSFTVAPATAVAGEPVTFEVAWSDGDALLSFDHLSTDGTALGGSCALEPEYGPWTPPAPTGGRGTKTYTPKFAAPGTYRVIVSMSTSACGLPYSSDAQVATTIVVTSAAALG